MFVDDSVTSDNAKNVFVPVIANIIGIGIIYLLGILITIAVLYKAL